MTLCTPPDRWDDEDEELPKAAHTCETSTDDCVVCVEAQRDLETHRTVHGQEGFLGEREYAGNLGEEQWQKHLEHVKVLDLIKQARNVATAQERSRHLPARVL